MSNKLHAQAIPQIQKDKYNLMPHELADLQSIQDKSEALLYLSSLVAMENNLTEVTPHGFIDDKAKNELSLIHPYIYGQNHTRDRAHRLRSRLAGLEILPFPDETFLHLGDGDAHDLPVPDLAVIVSFNWQQYYDGTTGALSYVAVAMDSRAEMPGIAGELRNSSTIINPTGNYLCVGKKSLSIRALAGLGVSIHFWRETFI